MKILVIQYPPDKETGETVHPIRIDMVTGTVLDQEFWKGIPGKFIGFVRYEKGTAFYVELPAVNSLTAKEIQERFFPMFYSKYTGTPFEDITTTTEIHKRNDYTLSFMDLVEDEDPSEEPPAPPKKKTVWHESIEEPEDNDRVILFDRDGQLTLAAFWFVADGQWFTKECDTLPFSPCRWAYWEDIKNC